MQDDLLSRRGSAFFWWCLPVVVGFATDFLSSNVTLIAAVWSVCLAMMGTGCVLNALRCRRLHCYIAGPIFIIAALFELAIAIGLLSLGRHAANNIAGAALLLGLLSFVPEMALGRYVGR